MLRVRSKSDREQLTRLMKQAERRALDPRCKNWLKHSQIAQHLRREIEGMLIFEDYTIGANGALRRAKHDQ